MSEDLETLTKRIQHDWDTRIGFDYLAWMNDRVSDDSALFKSGERDFVQITQELDSTFLSSLSVLDIGCGVGRLLRSAANSCKSVFGTDISEEAVHRCRDFLSGFDNSEIKKGDGRSLEHYEEDSFDLIYSFGTLSNIPTILFAEYLNEISRTLKIGGIARLQLFTGKCQPTLREDSAAFRSYHADLLSGVFHDLGLQVEWYRDLEIDEEIPDDGWLRPQIVSLRKQSRGYTPPQIIERQLLGDTAELSAPDLSVSPTEIYLTKLRLGELIDRKDIEAASSTLAYLKERGNEDQEIARLEQRLQNELPSVSDNS